MYSLRTLSRTPAKAKLATTLQSKNLPRFVSTQTSQAAYLLQDKDNGLGFIRSNPRTPKPRDRGVTEVRGPYYSAYGKRHWQDVLDIMGHHIDGLKFAGGSFSLMPEKSVRELIDLAHKHDVYVSTASASPCILNPADRIKGGFMEHVLTHPDVMSVVDRYLQKCKDVGYAIHTKNTTTILNPDQFRRRRALERLPLSPTRRLVAPCRTRAQLRPESQA